jgi:hypothetical protein
MLESFLASPFLIAMRWDSCIRGFELYTFSTQRPYPCFVPSKALYSTLPSGLASAVGDKISITVNGFEHGSHNACLKAIEHCLQAMLEVKEFRWRFDGAPALGLLMQLVP